MNTPPKILLSVLLAYILISYIYNLYIAAEITGVLTTTEKVFLWSFNILGFVAVIAFSVYSSFIGTAWC